MLTVKHVIVILAYIIFFPVVLTVLTLYIRLYVLKMEIILLSFNGNYGKWK